MKHCLVVFQVSEQPQRLTLVCLENDRLVIVTKAWKRKKEDN